MSALVNAPDRFIHVVGGREHNLQDIEVRIPRDALTVVTGVSGSGKSSLAVDTIYAEGQRRFLEGVSVHARRFLERFPRPDVEAIRGLSPAVALDARSTVRSARSTVGTSTEIYDYLRVLFARVGRVACERCRRDVPTWTVHSVAAVWASAPGRLVVSFPADGITPDTSRALGARGYRRRIEGGEVIDLDADLPSGTTWDVVQDRVPPGQQGRLVEALESAFREGGGRAAVHDEAGTVSRYRLGRACPVCDLPAADPEPLHFSFNSPAGACPACQGFGFTLEFDLDKIVPDPGRSLAEGALVPWAGRWRSYFLRKLQLSGRGNRIPREVPWRELSEADRCFLLEGGERFPGVLGFLERLTRKRYRPGARFAVKRYQSAVPCAACEGTRLGPAGRRVRLLGETLPEWCAWPVGELRRRLDDLPRVLPEAERVAPLLAELIHRVRVLEKVGLSYLTLSRLTRTLSGGEAQRIEIAQALGARLTGALYVLDEPTIGLHPRETQHLLEVLRELVGAGNTVIVVEHDLDALAASDWMVDLGPGSGRHGGQVLYAGPTRDRLSGPPSPTAALLADRRPMPRPPLRDPQGWLRVRGAGLHNLKRIDVDLPWGLLIGVCGQSGSGKSTLVAETLIPLLDAVEREGRRGEVEGTRGASTVQPGRGEIRVDAPYRGHRVVDQTPLARSARSIPASYVGAWNGIRALFAALPESRRRGYRPGTFSFNVPGGRCEACRGEGETAVDMDFMAELRLPCETCAGTRFSPEAVRPRYRGHSIVDVLGLTVEDAVTLFAHLPTVARPLKTLAAVGLGYLTLGQPAPSLSGGEAQRLKLARELCTGARDLLFVLDEPTVGLHGQEVRLLVGLLTELVEAGNTVVVIEHHVDVLTACHWLLELGPGGGAEGGRLLAAGPPEVVARHPETRIGPYLTPRLAAGRRTAADLFPCPG